jgi:hypothetical protein
MKITLIGILLISITLVLIYILKKNSSQKLFVIGKEMAYANEKEQDRIQRKDFEESPLAGYSYSNDYGERTLENPKENDLDKKIIELGLQYKTYDNSNRNQFRNSLTQDDIYTLFTFCKRATIFGIRGNPEYLKNGMTVISMVDVERCDYRDALVSLSFLNHGLEKMNMNSDELYRESINHANDKMGELISSFQKRKPNDKAIEAMAGYTEYKFKEGIGFVSCGYSKYFPIHDLPFIALEISDYLMHDKYLRGQITIAESLSLYWVDSENDETVQKSLNQSIGTVSLNSNPNEEFVKDNMTQMLLLYIVEFKTKEEANSFLKLIGNVESSKFARIINVVDEIFYILIERSIKEGVEDFESNESLLRFKEPLEKIIRKNCH